MRSRVLRHTTPTRAVSGIAAQLTYMQSRHVSALSTNHGNQKAASIKAIGKANAT